jgi:hypothetical protein
MFPGISRAQAVQDAMGGTFNEEMQKVNANLQNLRNNARMSMNQTVIAKPTQPKRNTPNESNIQSNESEMFRTKAQST